MNKEKHKMNGSELRRINLVRLFVICFAVVAGLFLIYEVVERAWLTGIDPAALHALHIMRGLCAAAIGSVLATLVILRQTDDRILESTVLPPGSSWKRRLQNVRLRTKITVPMVALTIFPAFIVGFLTIAQMRKSLLESAIQRVEFDVTSRAQAVQEFLDSVQQDLLFLRRMDEVRGLIAAETSGTAEMVESLRQKLEQKFLVFSQGKRAYYQIRFISSAGRELVRLNVEDGAPEIVPVEQLQDKSNRYYVKAAFALKPGQIYVSQMDLNMERGTLEIPARGVVRYAAVASENKGKGLGLVVINLHSDFLLSLIGPLPSRTEAWLVDQDETYLGYVGESKERQTLFGLEKRRHLSEDFTADECVSILKGSDCELSLQVKSAFFFSSPLSIDIGDTTRRWTLVIGYPKAPITDPIRYLSTFLSIVMGLLVALVAIMGILIGDYLARPIMRLQHATRDIAAGNLEKRVNITTGDEIERLANDFNTMTDRLHKAHKQLFSQNLNLQREVESQTEIQRRLQNGMAQADKLASIGQITAGVMHEVGNPLASIKTKIQVANEDGSMCEECKTLTDEIVDEVNRLAAFLRSFSRLSRLGSEQVKENVSLSEVADGVVALVCADLRRKGVAVRCEAAKDAPQIRGIVNQLRQLLLNLILNAADASPHGTEVTVKIRSAGVASHGSDSSARVIIEVTDEGKGISKDIIDKIWDPFFTTKKDGTGLGLAICRTIAQDHDGTISITSEHGKGTVVTVTFPCYSEGSA